MKAPLPAAPAPVLSFSRLVSQLRDTFAHFPDSRKAGPNTRYTVADAALSAFSAFFMQCPSFLDYQRRMEDSRGRSNAHSLFGVHAIPCDNQIRNLLDGVPPQTLEPVFDFIRQGLQQDGYLQTFPVPDYGWLLLLDGTQHFSSHRLHCPHCLERHHANGSVTYLHQVLTPVLATPESTQVIPLPPEFIQQQDGQDKQDCELAAAHRWLGRFARDSLPGKVTLLGDDLFCHQPFCQRVLDAGYGFIFTCKPTSHLTLYEWLASLEKVGAVSSVQTTRWTGRHHVTDTYRFARQLPLRDGDDSMVLHVNWCELTSIREDGKVLYHNTFATSHPITADTVAALVRAARCRWKIENENNNTLKTKGYRFEHNYGHGKQHLANLLATLSVLAFLVHSAINLIDLRFRQLRQRLGSRQSLFQPINALTTFIYFPDWTGLLDFMLQGLHSRHVWTEFIQQEVK